MTTILSFHCIHTVCIIVCLRLHVQGVHVCCVEGVGRNVCKDGSWVGGRDREDEMNFVSRWIGHLHCSCFLCVCVCVCVCVLVNKRGRVCGRGFREREREYSVAAFHIFLNCSSLV